MKRNLLRTAMACMLMQTVSPKNQGFRYNQNAETYMDVGTALGRAMKELFSE